MQKIRFSDNADEDNKSSFATLLKRNNLNDDDENL